MSDLREAKDSYYRLKLKFESHTISVDECIEMNRLQRLIFGLKERRDNERDPYNSEELS